MLARTLFAGFLTLGLAAACNAQTPDNAAASDADAAIDAAVNDNVYRTPEQTARDRYRHPAETLKFFGLTPEMAVAEALPGWYTEILGDLLHDNGAYYAINLPPDPNGDAERFQRSMQWRDSYIQSKGDLFGDRAYARFLLSDVGFAPPESMDAVLAFRAFHGWVYAGKVDEVLAEVFTALKPGGILGIVQHREDEDSDNSPYSRRGYLKQSFVTDVVQMAGFELVEASEINANPADTKDYEIGVWALPPVLYGDDEEAKRERRAIGESDRMTLKFRKPVPAADE